MPRPEKLKTQIFLDSGDPAETRQALKLLGFLDGQTTSPTLISRNPEVQTRLAEMRKFSEPEARNFYRLVVSDISGLLPSGLVSIEVNADEKTTSQSMVEQAREMNSWIPNARIKLPIIRSGLEAAAELAREGVRISMTLCFSQSQAAAVSAAVRTTECGQISVTPLVGRLESVGLRGVDLVENCIRMYRGQPNASVHVSVASVRTTEHFLAALAAGADSVAVPIKILQEWAVAGMPLPGEEFSYAPAGLEPISFEEIDVDKNWDAYDLQHRLTDQGLRRFADDWNELIN